MRMAFNGRARPPSFMVRYNSPHVTFIVRFQEILRFPQTPGQLLLVKMPLFLFYARLIMEE